jgi:hypothetical protein
MVYVFLSEKLFLKSGMEPGTSYSLWHRSNY